MAVDTSGLRTELLTDPANLGYAPLISGGADQSLADTLNLRRSGTAVDGKSYSIFRNDIQPKEIVNAIGSGDFAGATQIQITKLNLLFVATPIDATLANVRANFIGIFAGATSGTISNLTNLASRNGSRAEVLFGTGTSVNSSDISLALRGVK